MSIFPRNILLAALGLPVAVGITGVLAGGGGPGVFSRVLPTGGSSAPMMAAVQPQQLAGAMAAAASESGRVEILGEVIDCPPPGAGPEDAQAKFQMEGAEFEVTGVLKSRDTASVVVAGPSGDLTAALALNTEIKGDPQPGDPVKVQGQAVQDGTFAAREVAPACQAAPPEGVPPEGVPPQVVPPDVVPPVVAVQECNRGPGTAGDFRLEIKDGEVEVKRGTVLSFADGVLMIETPFGPISVMVEGAEEVKGDLSTAAEVRVEGFLEDDDTVKAEEVKVLCPNPEDVDEVEIEDEDEDDVRIEVDDDDEADDEDDDDDDAVPTPGFGVTIGKDHHGDEEHHDDDGDGHSGHGGGDDDGDGDHSGHGHGGDD